MQPSTYILFSKKIYTFEEVSGGQLDSDWVIEILALECVHMLGIIALCLGFEYSATFPENLIWV